MDYTMRIRLASSRTHDIIIGRNKNILNERV